MAGWKGGGEQDKEERRGVKGGMQMYTLPSLQDTSSEHTVTDHHQHPHPAHLPFSCAPGQGLQVRMCVNIYSVSMYINTVIF